MGKKLITWAEYGVCHGNVIPDRALVTFQIGDSEIDVRLRDGKLIITGNDSLIITPRAANQIFIVQGGSVT